ncbi:MAG: MFS transporter [Chloroflexi bacterium]|nr:MFS transporter [Chloroflexota bacterium]
MSQRDFRYLTLSSASLGFGQWFQQIGLGWLVFQLTGSPAQMGTITFVRGIMVLVASPPAGVLSDRFSRRTIIMWTALVNAAQAVALAVLVIAELAQPWHLYGFAIISGAIQAVAQPARQAFVYDVTTREMLTNAMAVNSLAQNLARVMGPPLAGVMIGLLGTASSFFMLAIFNLTALGFTSMIHTRTQFKPAQQKESPLTAMMGGLRYSLQHRLILALLLTTIIGPMLVFPWVQYLPVFATEVLNGGPETYGLLATGVGWGSLIGLLAVAYVGDIKRKGLAIVVGQIGYASMVLAFTRTDSLAVGMLCLVVAGIFFSVMQVMVQTLFQLAVSNDMRGRVMALYSMEGGFQPVGSLPMGFAIERWGAPNTVMGFMLLAITAMMSVTVFFPELRRAELAAAQEEARPVPVT